MGITTERPLQKAGFFYTEGRARTAPSPADIAVLLALHITVNIHGDARFHDVSQRHWFECRPPGQGAVAAGSAPFPSPLCGLGSLATAAAGRSRRGCSVAHGALHRRQHRQLGLTVGLSIRVLKGIAEIQSSPQLGARARAGTAASLDTVSKVAVGHSSDSMDSTDPAPYRLKRTTWADISIIQA